MLSRRTKYGPGIGILGRTGVALVQQASDHAAGLGQREDQRRLDPDSDMAVEGRAAFVAEHLDQQAIDIQRQVHLPFTAVRRGQSPDHQPQQTFMQSIDVVAPAQAGQQPRQRGLERPVLRQWHRAQCIAARQLPERIAAQRGGITEIDPAHGMLQHHGAQLTGQRVTDTIRVALVEQVILKCGDHAAVVEGFAQQQGIAIAGCPLAIKFNADGYIAGWCQGG
jgi:hypothetical protein